MLKLFKNYTTCKKANINIYSVKMSCLGYYFSPNYNNNKKQNPF